MERVCGNCEYFGFYQEMLLSAWELDAIGGYTRHFLGFDKAQGAD